MLNKLQTAAFEKRYMDAPISFKGSPNVVRLDEIGRSKKHMQFDTLIQNETLVSKSVHFGKETSGISQSSQSCFSNDNCDSLMRGVTTTLRDSLTLLTRNNANTAEADTKE